MILLKLGGSVVTDKSKPYNFRRTVVERLAEEIKDTQKEILIVHGGGSFGHPVAHKYNLKGGLKGERQLEGIAKTRIAMDELNFRIVRAFLDHELPAVSIQTSAVFECENGRIRNSDISDIGVIKKSLDLGLIPVLYGDVVFDELLGVCILSGDQIISFLAKNLKANRVIFATDVDGVLDKKGKLIELVYPGNSRAVLGSISAIEGDVTGGMRGKVEELIELSKDGIPSIIINALEGGVLKNALLGNKTKGTLFKSIS